MKKQLFFAALALVAMASCTSDENVTVVSPPDPVTEEVEPAISFNMASRTATRADHYGFDAATLLNKKFIVSAFKGDGSTMDVTMPDYIVTYTDNTAGTTESNTSDWEYVGNPAVAPSSIAGNTQTIKYWDYSTAQYDFIAYSTGTADIRPLASGETVEGVITDGKVVVTPIDRDNATTAAYKFGGSVDELKNCYVADMVTVYKNGTGGKNYGDEVQLVFRNLTSKVRMAIYETIPGYSVKEVKFYTDATTTLADGASQTDATLFTTGTDTKDNFYTKGVYTVYFDNIGSANISNTDYNKAHVSFAPVASSATSSGGTSLTQSYGALNYNTGDTEGIFSASDGSFLGRTLPYASYAGTSPYYKTVLPNEEGTVLELRIDYTLEATDGSGEEIKIHGATAFVPAIYAAWKPNYAYTYIFKISDNTNGWTSTAGGGPTGTDPAGLYPITFDAVVVDSEDYTQSTVTTVATPSITTYQKGHDVSQDEYAAADGKIYVQVMKGGNLLKVNDADHPAQVWKITNNTNGINVTEATVMDALNIREVVSTNYTTGRNGLTLTKVTTTTDITAIPGVDGNDISISAGDAAVFTPEAGTFVFTYKDDASAAATTFNTAVDLTSEPAGWPTGYFTDFDCTNAAPATFAPGTYYKQYTNRNIVWGAKVIIVK